MNLRFRCPPELEAILPQPIPAVLGLPDWFKSMPSQAFNPSMGIADHTVKKCPPFIDAMTYGFLISLAADLVVRDGEFTVEVRDAARLRRQIPPFTHRFS